MIGATVQAHLRNLDTNKGVIAMRMVDLIVKTRRKEALSDDEIHAIVSGFTKGEIPDYQMSAWMMAVCLEGMTKQEISELTLAMMNSGEIVKLDDLAGVKVDKHSTGGVGDSTTLIAAPLVAACGGTVAKMSGRGLGHTGGTLDKLESVPGVSVELTMERFKQIVADIGLCVMGQTKNLVPADKLMYALRDVTGTVEGIPLIASSIMSKKLASGAEAIVLDVKAGSGAFMHNAEDAERLARTMVDIGNHMGRRTMALITDMNQPLGLAVGNGLEIIEAMEALSGKLDEDDHLLNVSLMLAAKMLIASGLAKTAEEARKMLMEKLASGEGLNRLKKMLYAMGGKEEYIENPDKLAAVKRLVDVYPDDSGYIGDMRAESIGVAAQLLGAGRAKKGDIIDPATGLVMHVRRGDRVTKHDPIATMYVNDDSHLEDAVAMLKSAVAITAQKPNDIPMVYKEVD